MRKCGVSGGPTEYRECLRLRPDCANRDRPTLPHALAAHCAAAEGQGQGEADQLRPLVLRAAPSSVSGAWRPQAMAAEARERRRAAALQQLLRQILGADAEAPRLAGGDPAPRQAFGHLEAASAGRRGWPRRQAGSPQERGGDAVALHPRDARR
jgi:hypothetical protein